MAQRPVIANAGGLPPMRPKLTPASGSTSSTGFQNVEGDSSRALQRAAGDFTTWKVREGLVVSAALPMWSGNDASIPPEVQQALTQQMPVSTIAYAFIRRYAQRKSNECVMVLLEDITQYERITAVSSRLKWAKAICASVQVSDHERLKQEPIIHSDKPHSYRDQ